MLSSSQIERLKNRKTKKCSICKKDRPIEFFLKEVRRIDGRGYLCTECRKDYYNSRYKKNPAHFKEIQKKYLKNNPRSRLNSSLKSDFGITIEQFDLMMKLQNGLCAICKGPEIVKHQNGNVRQLSVDHNHKNGKVRGLLCTRCNQGIGSLREDRNILTNALEYLEKNS